MSTHQLQKMIHVGCRVLGLDQDARRDLQLLACDKASMTDMSEADLLKVVDALKEKGFRPQKGGRRPTARRADVRFCHVLWKLLFEAGEAKVKGAKGLNAFIRARFETKWVAVPIDIDAMDDWAKINDVVEALKSWCDRAGVELDK